MDCYNNFPCNYKLEIFDLMGRKIFNTKVKNSGKRNVIDLREYISKTGVYLYKITSNGIVIGTGKIIK